MKPTSLILASLAAVATAGPVLNPRQLQIDMSKLDERQKAIVNCVQDMAAKFDCKLVEGKPDSKCLADQSVERGKCIREKLAALPKEEPAAAPAKQPAAPATATKPAAAQPNEPAETLESQVQKHCSRPGNDQAACRLAQRFCKAREPSDDAAKFLECIDIMQVCADQGARGNLEECIANAKECNAREKAPLGELTKLGECAKKNFEDAVLPPTFSS